MTTKPNDIIFADAVIVESTGCQRRSADAISIKGFDHNGTPRHLVITWDGLITIEKDLKKDRWGALEELDAWANWATKVAGHHAKNFPATPHGLRDAVMGRIIDVDHKAAVTKNDAENFKSMCRDKDERIRDLTVCLRRMTEERDEYERRLNNLRLSVRAAASADEIA